MYVPPINGSEILVWKADMPTNWIVLQVKVSAVRRLDDRRGYPEKLWRMLWITRNARNPFGIGDNGNQ